MNRREFLAASARLAATSLTLAALPRWARGALVPAAELIERNDWPEHWETTLAALGREPITANERFFVRSHFPVPGVDRRTWRLELAGLVETPLALALSDLQRETPVEQAITLECAGNGRGRLPLANTSGTQWDCGAVGTALWRGVPLRVLLERAGVRAGAAHVWFECADQATLPDAPRFLRSIPLGKAMDDVMLAWSMNGAPLAARHGGPVRALVPGWYGMASAKWLTGVRVAAEPSDNHFMVRGYRYVPPGGDPSASPPVDELRPKSLITWPLEGARVRAGLLAVRGFAWAAREIERVEVSSDGGVHWTSAALGRLTVPTLASTWRPWTASVVAKAGPFELLARATDRGGEAQPLAPQLNIGGYGNNSVHRVQVQVHA